jgi:hypothetical protein
LGGFFKKSIHPCALSPGFLSGERFSAEQRDTAVTIFAVSMTLLKLQVLFLPLKGKSSKNISMANIPILYK